MAGFRVVVLGLWREAGEQVVSSQVSRLAMLKAQLEKAQHRVEEQAARVEQMAADGLNTVAAEHLLATYLTLLDLFIEHTERVASSMREFSPSGQVTKFER